MKRFVVLALLLASGVVYSAPPAQATCSPHPVCCPTNPQCWVTSASADSAVITGSGTISPGLTLVPAPQSISFDGTATVVGTHGVLATYSCSFTGNDIAGSAAEGVGTVSGSCGPISFSNCNFVRVAVAVVVVCHSLPTVPVKVGVGVCVFTPADVNPTTSYSLVCKAEYVAVLESRHP